MDDSKDSKDKSSPPKQILDTGHELKKALDAWNELAKKPAGVSADEQMLQDVKDLLKQLKDQIEEFQ